MSPGRDARWGGPTGGRDGRPGRSGDRSGRSGDRPGSGRAQTGKGRGQADGDQPGKGRGQAGKGGGRPGRGDGQAGSGGRSGKGGGQTGRSGGRDSRGGGRQPPARRTEPRRTEPRRTEPRRAVAAESRGDRSRTERPGRPARAAASARPGPPRRGGRRPAPRRAASLPPVAFFGAAAGLLVIVLILVTAGLVLRDGDPPPPQVAFGEPAASGVTPSSYSRSPSTEVFDAINTRTADRAPLTVREVFPKEARSLPAPAGSSLTLRGNRLDGDCAEAVWGAGLGGVLRAGQCNQAVRGVYASGTYAVTIAIFNLAAVEDANRAVDALAGRGFVRPLPLAAPLDRLGRGFSLARGLAMGHYVVVGWVQRLDGQGDAQDEALLSLLVEAGGSQAVLGRAARSGAGG
jgi:hypothetical protein